MSQSHEIDIGGSALESLVTTLLDALGRRDGATAHGLLRPGGRIVAVGSDDGFAGDGDFTRFADALHGSSAPMRYRADAFVTDVAAALCCCEFTLIDTGRPARAGCAFVDVADARIARAWLYLQPADAR